MRYSWVIDSHTGMVRADNEDTFFPESDDASDGPVLIAVADGMGGAAAGEVASRLAIDASTADPVDEAGVAARLDAANRAVIEATIAEPAYRGMGTTLTMGIFEPDGMLHIGHVGDSRAYLVRDGELRRLTRDDTVVEEMVTAGMISEDEARNHPRRHLITQSLGMADIAIQVIDEQLREDDRVLLCSDGLTSMIDDDGIRDVLAHAETPADAVWLLIDAANAAGGHDNTTVAVVDVGMTRNAEASLLAAASVLAAIGVTLANFAAGAGLDAQVALTFLVFALAFGGIHLALRRWAASANPYLFPLAAFLAAIGFVMVYRLDPQLAALQRWSLLVAAAVSSSLLFLLRNEGVAMLRRYRYVFLLTAVGLLLLPLLPEGLPIHGAEVFGSRLWVRIELPMGGRTLSFQPGEIAKVLLTVFLASYLADRYLAMASGDRKIGPLTMPDLRQLFPVVLAGVASFLVLVYQRDLGASLLLFGLFIGMMYIATGRAVYLGFGAVFVGIAGFLAYQMFGHVQRRVEAWLRPFDDFADSGYQIAQSLFALGSGSITGSGIGMGRPDLIPAAATDFVFAAVGEEIGFAGSVAVIAAYALLVAAGFGIALRARDVFRKFLAAGLTLVLGMQAVLIIAGVIRLLPVTGITLPFMSYGGSSLVANLVMVTLLARISHGERT